MTNEDISNISRNYNSALDIEECVNSVLRQTSGRWDIYIVDDASTDSSKEIYGKYLHNQKISIIYNKKNLGYIRSLKK